MIILMNMNRLVGKIEMQFVDLVYIWIEVLSFSNNTHVHYGISDYGNVFVICECRQ